MCYLLVAYPVVLMTDVYRLFVGSGGGLPSSRLWLINKELLPLFKLLTSKIKYLYYDWMFY